VAFETVAAVTVTSSISSGICFFEKDVPVRRRRFLPSFGIGLAGLQEHLLAFHVYKQNG
jgi:hypothetical protein